MKQQSSGSSGDLTQLEIQRQIDEMAAGGGGTVSIPPGIIMLSSALRLRSGVRLLGSDGTILHRTPSVASRLVDRVGYGHYEFTVEDPDLFPVGSGVHIYDDLAWGFYTTVATVVGRRGDLIFIDQPFAHDYGPRANGTVVRLFSVVDGTDIHDAALLNLELDGNSEETRTLDGCRGAGVFLLRAHRILIDNVNVRHFRGDGISFQACTDVIVRCSDVHHNTGIGVHPGSGTVRYLIEGNHIHDNGSHGIFYCLRSSHSICQGNEIENNDETGISVGERDTHHLLRSNTIVRNGRQGIEFREFVCRGGDHVRVEANIIGPNCQLAGEHEVTITAGHREVCLTRNRFMPARNKIPVHVGLTCAEISLFDNKVHGNELTPRHVEAAADSVCYAAPAALPDVGPATLPLDGARHLNIDVLPPWSAVDREREK